MKTNRPVFCLDDCLLLDNQASASVFKDEHLLENLTSCVPCHIHGILKDEESYIIASRSGSYKGINNIYACASASANIISFSQTQPIVVFHIIMMTIVLN